MRGAARCHLAAGEALRQVTQLRGGSVQLEDGQVGAIGHAHGAHACRQLPGGGAVMRHHGTAVMQDQHAAGLAENGLQGACAPVR